MWLFYDYEEHGPDNLRATNDESKLQGFLEDWIAERYNPDSYTRERTNFEKFRESGFNPELGFVGTGWGGPVFEKVEVE